MIIKVDKANWLAALRFKGKNDVRYYLNAVFFDEDNSLVASDGHRMFVGKHKGVEKSILISVEGKPPTRFYMAEINTEQGTVFYINEKGERVAAGVAAVVDHHYANWRQLARGFKCTPVREMAFNGDYLTDIFQCAKFFNAHNSVKIEHSGAGKASRFTYSPEAYALLMPMRI